MPEFFTPSSAMAVVAHPDDIEFTCAGTLARWARNGARICYVLCTSGEVGIAQAGMTQEKAASIREAEQRGSPDCRRAGSCLPQGAGWTSPSHPGTS